MRFLIGILTLDSVLDSITLAVSAGHSWYMCVDTSGVVIWASKCIESSDCCVSSFSITTQVWGYRMGSPGALYISGKH